MKKFLTISLLALACSVTGCATIFTGTKQKISFNSEPIQSQISISNHKGEVVHTGETPATVKLRKGRGYFMPAKYTVVFNKEGYQTHTVNINARMSGWYVGNIIFGGVVGFLIVDPLTGAMYTLKPNDIQAVLNEANAEGEGQNQTLTVVLKENIPEDIMAKAIKLN